MHLVLACSANSLSYCISVPLSAGIVAAADAAVAAAGAAAAARVETELRDRTAELSSTLRARNEEAAQAQAAAARERKDKVKCNETMQPCWAARSTGQLLEEYSHHMRCSGLD
jgi:hypothetical protein